MVRYKVIDTSPRFLAVYLEKQLLPAVLNTRRITCWITNSICRYSISNNYCQH
jgi:hypothetical protein